VKRVALLAALVLAGCGQSKDEGISGGGKVIGRTVTVYSLTADPGTTNRAFVDGEKLALRDAGGRAGEFAINFTSLDLGTDEDAQADATRRAINDPQVIAAIADATRVTVPLLNAAGILQVAPSGDPALVSDPDQLPSGRSTVGGLEGSVPADFADRYEAEFGRAPDRSAEDGYRAMAAVLAAIKTAGAAGNDRTRVIESYL
jgi:hypothetical protein